MGHQFVLGEHDIQILERTDERGGQCHHVVEPGSERGQDGERVSFFAAI